jgi:hypothetical protein
MSSENKAHSRSLEEESLWTPRLSCTAAQENVVYAGAPLFMHTSLSTFSQAPWHTASRKLQRHDDKSRTGTRSRLIANPLLYLDGPRS